MARSRQSRRDVENLAANSMRFEKPTNTMARSLRSRHDICWFFKHHGEVSTNLGEMEDISPRSHRELEFHERHGEISTISARSQQSRRDGTYLAAISPRFRIQEKSWRDLGEISSILMRSCRSQRDLANLGEISVKILHGLRFKVSYIFRISIPFVLLEQSIELNLVAFLSFI